ncbi:hypothetical protein NWQ34_00835 [Mycoplasmopsis felis]|uniref:hypothetical protein n=1 Tax=Mycoplasmopsis felis TaxID=33923 RepID=UPI0021E051BC|nr:hypothetical protein [Mycoplasmopsis felis]MCU9938258.1 hypothetical protein [Mycoplasmopsis felis]
MDNKNKLNFIQFRKEEIVYAIAKEKNKNNKLIQKQKEKELPIYKKSLFVNLILTSVALIIIIGLLLVAFYIGKTL